jgi:4'-phosphopantetheinyl transferase
VPLHTKKHINNGIVALWHITETKDELIDLLPESWQANLDMDHVQPHNLAARVLAHTVCPEFNILEKDAYGKPYFDSADAKISITHAGEYAAFMLANTRDCGIDMEQITERVRRIQSKFVRMDEEAFLAHDLRGLYMLWCAKEALYKFYGLKSIDFKKHLKVDYQPIEESGILLGHIEKDDYSKTLELNYEFFDNYLILHTA